MSRRALAAHILESCSNDGFHQEIRSESSIREVCVGRSSLTNDTLAHFWCGWCLHDDSTSRCLRSMDTIHSVIFTSWSDRHPIDQRYHANGSSCIKHQLFCLLARILSTDSRWSYGSGIDDEPSEYLHVGMGTVLRRASTGMHWTLWLRSTFLKGKVKDDLDSKRMSIIMRSQWELYWKWVQNSSV